MKGNHKDKKEFIFLLGGRDLEMEEIRRLLVMHNFAYEDKRLTWSTARLSAYDEAIDRHPDRPFVGIELQEDRPLPAYYTRIDHHNDFIDRPASILQVAQWLGVAPDRHLRLVAANDAGYIPAMRALGATDEEIADIRRQDRAIQGVTEDDERLAAQSIAEHLSKVGDLLVVRSLTPRFSCICDRLFPYRRLFVYTDEEWIFFGEGASDWVLALEEDIQKGRIYRGGGPSGYIGAVKGAFSTEQIQQMLQQVKNRYDA